MRNTVIYLASSLLIACGSGSSSPGPDPLPTCRSGNCGQASFRRAVPTPARAKIGKPRRANKRPLEAVSPMLVEVEAYIDEVNGVVESVLDDVEELAGTTPEIETDDEHLWRAATDDPGEEEVLHLETTDGITYEVTYLVGPAGFDPEDGVALIHGEMVFADDELEEFHLTLDLDADDSDDFSGEIVIAEMPLEGGEHELWFDFHDVDLGDGDVENSRTTYWSFDEDSAALEFVADRDGEETTAYARWDDTGGRYDHHAAYVDETLGPVDEIATNCWDAGGAEVFDAEAVFDADLDYYGELDGDEADCVFGPVEDHPDPGEDFDDLPAEGEWDDLELASMP